MAVPDDGSAESYLGLQHGGSSVTDWIPCGCRSDGPECQGTGSSPVPNEPTQSQYSDCQCEGRLPRIFLGPGGGPPPDRAEPVAGPLLLRPAAVRAVVDEFGHGVVGTPEGLLDAWQVVAHAALEQRVQT